jgi:sterol desaturase/sphingolipid hydroxylase (fatty acid hydroxylase superfamily)
MLYDFLCFQGAELLRAAALVGGFLVLERLFPIERQAARAVAFNAVFALTSFAVITFCAYWIVQGHQLALLFRQASVGDSNFVRQSVDAVELAARVLVYLLVVDFFSYWRHRAMHAWPLLWRVHKLHHSETVMNTTTARRDHWLNEIIYFAVVALPALVLFGALDVPGWVLLLYFGFPFYSHANIRLCLGPLTPVIVGPQLHRIHHSRLPEHQDTNFAPMFPVYDIIFGTYHAPKRGEFAPAGLSSGETIDTQWQAHLSPFQRGRPVISAAVARD